MFFCRNFIDLIGSGKKRYLGPRLFIPLLKKEKRTCTQSRGGNTEKLFKKKVLQGMLNIFLHFVKKIDFFIGRLGRLPPPSDGKHFEFFKSSYLSDFKLSSTMELQGLLQA